MKRSLLRLMCLTLALCLLAPFALAEEPEEVTEPTIRETLNYAPDALFVMNDALYAQTWGGVLKKVDGGWQEYSVLENASIMTMDMAEDGVYYLIRRYEEYNPATGDWEKPEDGVYAIGRMPLEASGELGAPEIVCGLQWDVNDDDYPQIDNMVMAGDRAYLLMHADEMDWDKLTLYGIDLTTGKATAAMSDTISGLSLYKDGLLMARWYDWEEMYDDRGQMIRTPEIVSINPANGETTMLASLPNANAGALVYDLKSDSVYFSDSSYVYRFDNSFSAPETVGYLIGGGNGRAGSKAVLYRDHYLISDWSDENYILSATIDPSLLPSRTLRVANSWYADESIRAFAKEHPDVAIEYVNDLSSYTAEFYQSHMTSPQAADVYSLGLPYMPYAALLHYGVLADLSSSETLMDLVSGMYPNMTDEYLLDGKLYGLPVYMYAQMYGYYPKAFEKVGLTEEDVPTTFGELLDFIVNWYYDYYDDYPEISLFEWSPDLRSSFVSLLFQQQVITCEARGEALTFRTPAIQQLLNRLDNQETKTVFDALGPKRDESGSMIISYVSAAVEEPTALFSNYYDPLPSMYQSWNPPEPMPMRVSEEDDPAIQTNLTLMVINRASQNQDLAMELLEYIAQNLQVDLLTTMRPDVNDPIEVSYYQENIEYYQKTIAEYEAEVAKLKEAGESEDENAISISDYEEMIGWYKENLARMEEEDRWAFSEKDVAYYKEHIAPYLVVSASSIFSGEDNPASNLMQMYIDGARDANFFVSEIDRIVNMMQQE